MHQHPRGPLPTTAARGNSPWTNPSAQTNNSRDSGQESLGSSPSSVDPRTLDQGELEGQLTSASMREAVAKLNQVVQNYHTKAALIILQSRILLPPTYTKGTDTKRINRWFNVEIDETDALKDYLKLWKQSDYLVHRPPTLYIDIYLDTSQLTSSESLVIIDGQEKRWDVLTSLNAAGGHNIEGKSADQKRVILERWKIELGNPASPLPADLGLILPTVYKKSIVLFRSLYMYCQLMPAWKFGKRLPKLRSNSSLKLSFDVFPDNLQTSHSDGLYAPLYEGSDPVVDTFSLGGTDSPAGPLSIQVTYRKNCDFRVDDSEALLSSHFMGMDDEFFRPSLESNRGQPLPQREPTREAGSVPLERMGYQNEPDRGQAYGSMSTFHQPGPAAGSSPISALRAASNTGPQSPVGSAPRPRPSSLRSMQNSKSSLRSVENASGPPRRPSVSFFKAPTLSSSPSPGEQLVPPSPRNSLNRPSPLSGLAEARSKQYQGLGHAPLSPAVPQRNFPTSENAIASSTSSSPKPAPIARYSSSFGHRKARPSTGGSKTEEDNSSGKTSATSSAAHPGSGTLAEGTAGSAESIHQDDGNIADFLRMIDSKRDLKSFRASNPAALEASTRRTNAILNKAQRMRDSNAQLSDSMSSSVHLHRSSSSSSRQLSNVPAMIVGTSISTSSSPGGKPISPHTPHTPAIPSRLSANSVLDYTQHEEDTDSHSQDEAAPNSEHGSSDDTARDAASNAIDIPTSPRSFQRPYRRSSSVAHRYRTSGFDEEIGDILPFGTRSASLGADERPALSLNALRGIQDTAGTATSTHHRDQPQSNPDVGSADDKKQDHSSSVESREEAQLPSRPSTSSLNSPLRPRLGRIGARGGHTSAQGSVTSFTGEGQGSDRRSGRYSFSRPGNNNLDEDEPLLFAMSDFRSTDDGDRSNSGKDSNSSAKRGSRRGGAPHPWG
ncbi:MAG: autophagy protein 13 [Cirrosporium novae-zelandiae]|nr:MAG: autophagy protein 13 [Cirrosporium novae-zelandiae]